MRVDGRRVAGLLLILGSVALPCVVAGSPASAAETSPRAPSELHDDLAAAQQLAAQINAARAAHGLRALSIHPGLRDIAQAHSHRMAAAGRIWHNDDLFSKGERARLGAKVLGENVGADGRDGKVESHEMYMASAPHRANILDPRFTAMGIGVTMVDGVAYSTEDFMQAAPPPPPPPAPKPVPPPPAAAPVVAQATTPPVAGGPVAEATPAAVTPRPTATTEPLAAAPILTAANPTSKARAAGSSVPVTLAGALVAVDGLLALAAARLGRASWAIAEVARG